MSGTDGRGPTCLAKAPGPFNSLSNQRGNVFRSAIQKIKSGNHVEDRINIRKTEDREFSKTGKRIFCEPVQDQHIGRQHDIRGSA